MKERKETPFPLVFRQLKLPELMWSVAQWPSYLQHDPYSCETDKQKFSNSVRKDNQFKLR